GAGSRRNRLERCIVHGPTNGDGVGTEGGAGTPDGNDGENVIEDCEISGAEDKGVKVASGSHLIVRRSCIHDNTNGGVQTTLGGHTVATENVIQHNLPNSAQNGLFVQGTSGDERTTLESSGNIVRFSGARGLSVTDNAEALFTDDYVADNQLVGSK